MQVCPAGHFSKDPQVCDLCGLPMSSAPGGDDSQAATWAMPAEPARGAQAPTAATPAEPAAHASSQAATTAMPSGADPAEPTPSSQAATTAIPVVEDSRAATTAIPADQIRASHAAATVLPDQAPAQATRAMPADDNPAATSVMPVTGPTSRPAGLGKTPAGQAATEFIPTPIPEPAPPVQPGPSTDPDWHGNASPPTGATAVLGGRQSTHWHAVLTVDAAWYAVQETSYRMPPEGAATIVQLTSATVTLGRASRSRGTSPDIDCSSDPGVSRSHARFELVDGHWYVEDLGSANGTYLANAGAPLPQNPIPVGRRVQVGPGDTVYVGAWTRVSIEDDDAWGPA